MKLYIIRHSEAVVADLVSLDEERYLTRKGKKRLLQAIKVWKKLEINFDMCFCSPFLRARQTASILRKKNIFPTKKIIINELHPAANTTELLQFLAKEANDLKIGLVGHNPLLKNLTEVLLKCDANCFQLKRAGLIELELIRSDNDFKAQLINIIQGYDPINN